MVRYSRPKGFWKDDGFYKHAPRGLVFIGSLLQLQNIRQVLIGGKNQHKTIYLQQKLIFFLLLSTDMGDLKGPVLRALLTFLTFGVYPDISLFSCLIPVKPHFNFQIPLKLPWLTRVSSYGEHVISFHRFTTAPPCSVMYAASTSYQIVRYILIFFIFCASAFDATNKSYLRMSQAFCKIQGVPVTIVFVLKNKTKPNPTPNNPPNT